MPELCVAHLVRKRNGSAPFEAFLDSYRSLPAGIEHDLLVIFKGFEDESDLTPYRALLGNLPFRRLSVPDEGFDIVPYRRAAEAFDYRHFCFLNSYSVVLAQNWLAKLYTHARAEGVGVVSATASCESIYTTYVRAWLAARPKRIYPGKYLSDYNHMRRALELRRYFAPFPNPHVRTNAFVIRREVMLALKVGDVRCKREAQGFESGRTGLTRQVMAMGLKPLVVGRDGHAYEKERWFESRTFRSGEQENLLVADNRTLEYGGAADDARKMLSQSAWGKKAVAATARAASRQRGSGDRTGNGS